MKFLILPFFLIALSLNGQVSEIVTAMEQGKTLGFDHDAQYLRFQNLNKLASDEDLISLTDHKSPAVRGYAFWALAKRHSSELERIFMDHLNDTEIVHQKNGCMVGDESVISFMRQVVTPYLYDPECKKLDDSIRELVQIK